MRLIDADALIDFLDIGHLRHPSELCFSEIEVANLLLQAPTVEAIPKEKLDEIVEKLKSAYIQMYDEYHEEYEPVVLLWEAIEIVKGVMNERD